MLDHLDSTVQRTVKCFLFIYLSSLDHLDPTIQRTVRNFLFIFYFKSFQSQVDEQ